MAYMVVTNGRKGPFISGKPSDELIASGADVRTVTGDPWPGLDTPARRLADDAAEKKLTEKKYSPRRGGA